MCSSNSLHHCCLSFSAGSCSDAFRSCCSSRQEEGQSSGPLPFTTTLQPGPCWPPAGCFCYGCSFIKPQHTFRTKFNTLHTRDEASWLSTPAARHSSSAGLLGCPASLLAPMVSNGHAGSSLMALAMPRPLHGQIPGARHCRTWMAAGDGLGPHRGID